MKIAVNTRFLIKNKMEGLGWHNYELCKALVAAHPEDEFLFVFDRSFDHRFIFGDNVKGYVLPPPARHPILWYTWFEWSLPAFLKVHRPDVFLTMDSYCSLRSGVPTLMITHDIAHIHYPEQIPNRVLNYYNKYVPLFLERADHVMTVSSYVRQDIIETYGIPGEKVSVALNALRGQFAPISAQEQQQVRDLYSGGKNYFFYLGAIHPRKNIDRLIRAFDIFKRQTGSDFRLLIGGRFAWQTGAIKDAYDVSAFQEDIKFLGYIAEDNLPKILGAAWALTYVSLFEGFGLPILEAMHCDVAVITSNKSSMPEVAGQAALLVNPEEVDEIAGAMKQLLEQKVRQRLIELGRVERQRFSWEATAQQVYARLKELADTRGI